MSERAEILTRVREALGPLTTRRALPNWDGAVVSVRPPSPTSGWELFAARFAAVHGTPLASVSDLVAVLERNHLRHGYCDPALWHHFRNAFPATFTVELAFDASRVDDYAFGITRASGAIAETGTVILTDLDTTRRLAALAPWMHVAVLYREQIFADIPAALAALPTDPNIIWVTGPSKTGDVEGIIVEGVHGPGVQAALLIESGDSGRD